MMGFIKCLLGAFSKSDEVRKCNNTNSLEISIYENETELVIISRLDNLGKGASGAAIQCMNIMLGLEERKGLNIAKN